MGKLHVNLTKFNSEKSKIVSSAKEVKSAEKSVTFGSYTNILSSSQMKTVCQEQKSESVNYISQVNMDMQNLSKLVHNLKKVDDYSESRMRIKVKH